jgi:isopropylmalate/homocitrate/citramalate synthase
MKLCDVTLREGDQLPGRDYEADAKITAGRELDSLGISFIQAGFPVTGEKDQRVVSTLSEETDAQVVALARAISSDIEVALEANPDVIEVFAPLRDRQLEHVIGKSREEMFDALQSCIDTARDGGASVHMTILDGFRTDVEHVRTAVKRFPTVEYVGIADTVGARTPPTVTSYLDELGRSVDLSAVGVHFHDDLGVATANAEAAYVAGVGKADVSVASLGERAGNTALEEIVAVGALEYDELFGCDVDRLIPTCEQVLDRLGESIDPRKPILGHEVTSHESGLHTAVMFEEPSLFEPFDPARFGGERTLTFGSGTGREAARMILERNGIDPTGTRVETLLTEFAEREPLTLSEAESLVRNTFDLQSDE